MIEQQWITVSTKMLTYFIHIYLVPNQYIRMVSEWSFDIEDWRFDDENSAL